MYYKRSETRCRIKRRMLNKLNNSVNYLIIDYLIIDYINSGFLGWQNAIDQTFLRILNYNRAIDLKIGLHLFENHDRRKSSEIERRLSYLRWQ